MTWAVKNLAHKARHLPSSVRLVLGAMGYFGRDDGTHIVARVDTIAEEAGMSVRQTQRIIRRLLTERVLICDRTAAGHRTAEFRIDLKRLTGADIGLPEVTGCHPYDDPQRCQDVTPSSDQKCHSVTSRGDIGVGSRGDTDVTPTKNRNLNSLTNTQTRAREEVGGEVKAEFQPSLMLPIGGERQKAEAQADDAWPSIWAAFKRWPNFDPDASETLARLAWQRTVTIPPEKFIACIEAHRQAKIEHNARRGRAGEALHTHPHNWIERDRKWAEYLAVEPAPEDTRPTTLAAEHAAALRRAGVSEADIASWFADGEFKPDPTPQFQASSSFKRSWIASNFAAQVARAFDDCTSITVKQERAAA